MSFAIGIDLGTTNSVAAVYRKGKIESIPIDGKKILPSVISFRDGDQMLVGFSAKARLYIDPDKSIASSKRFMGDPSKSYNILNRTITPVDVATAILSKIRQEASRYLGEDVKDAVITIPAYFTDAQREATRLAGERAGFNVMRLLSEPTAAAIAYGAEKERDQVIMVYDFGGGTFDVSILKVEKNSFKVLAVDGNSQLGGDDFDNAIVESVIHEAGISDRMMGGVSGSIAYQQIKEAAEQAKIELSQADIADIILPDILGTHIEQELTIERYNALIQPLLQASLDKVNDALKAASMTPRDISRVILVGGTTRNRAVRELLTKAVKQPYIADNVDEIVAHGAALVAANLHAPELDNAPDIDNTPALIDIEDVTAHSFGINLMMPDPNNPKKLVEAIEHLITKNTTLPCVGATFGFTLRPHQTMIKIGVFRTESYVPIPADKIGELSIPVSDQKYNVAALCLFELDLDGILTFSSAEVPKESPLLKEYQETGNVNLSQYHSMVASGKLKPVKVVINTKMHG